MNNEKEEMDNLIKDFILMTSKMTIKEVSDEFNYFTKGDIELFKKRKEKYSLGDEKFIENEIKSVENKYTARSFVDDDIKSIAFNEAVNNASSNFAHLYIMANIGNNRFNTDFMDLEVLHLCSLYQNPLHFYGKKIKDLNDSEVDFEIIIYLVQGINDCFYLKWLYEELSNLNTQQKTKNADTSNNDSLSRIKTPRNTKKNFNNRLNNEQIKVILRLTKEINLFKEPIKFKELKEIFNCTANKSYTINNNQNLAHLFNCLQPTYINSDWQSVIETNEHFKGRISQTFLTSKNLSVSLNNVTRNSATSKKISDIIGSL